MNSKVKLYGLGGILIILGFVIGALVFSSGSSTHDHEQSTSGSTDQTIWTCSMHPQIRMDEEGDCPICGMDLIPASQMQANIDPDAIRMSKTARALAKVETVVVGRSEGITANKSYSGQLVVNQDRIENLSANYKGRIEKLYVNAEGEQVKKGQVVAEIYAPELQIIKDEYNLALRQDNSSLLQSITRKIKNLELTPADIQNMRAGILKWKAPASGYITAIYVNQGDNIKVDQKLIQIADLSTLWAELDIYEGDLNTLNVGDSLRIDLPNQSDISGKVTFISPVLNAQTRSAKARVVIDNKNKMLKPGVFISAELEDKAPRPSDAQLQTLMIPQSAVLWTGERSVVYRQYEDEKGVFYKMIEVRTGKSTGDAIEILSGISAGDEIVSQGAFSIDSEAQLADKPSMMNKSKAITNGKQSNIQPENKYLKHYVEIKNALVSDDFEKAKTTVNEFKAFLRGQSSDKHNLEGILESMSKTTTIEDLRADFIQLSEDMIDLTETLDIDQKLYVQFCPMADSNEGASWLSLDSSIRNPYFGASMLTCGEVRDVISP